MKSSIAHNIKHRVVPNDEFNTSIELIKTLIPLVPIKQNDIVMDNAYGTGNWFSNLPNAIYSKDFFNDNRIVDWYVTNPPYSKLNKWLEKSCQARKGFAYLLGLHNITPRRIEMCKDFGITKIHLCKVFKWYGISAFIIWEKGKQGIINYDRTVWRDDMKERIK